MSGIPTPTPYSGSRDCADTDNGATDAYGDGCAGYTLYPSWCGGYDDDDFNSSEMCCACGGGETVDVEPPPACEDSEITFTLSDLFSDGFEATLSFDGTDMTGNTGDSFTFCLVDGEYSYTYSCGITVLSTHG